MKEIAAQIKLKFKNVTGEPIVVTRSMLLTQKANNKLEFKSREGVIQLHRNGEVYFTSFQFPPIVFLTNKIVF